MITLNGLPCHRAELHVPWRGRWVACAAYDGVVPIGRVSLTWGNAVLVGGVDPTGSGTWQGETLVTIVGGPGWGSVLPAGWLQNDAGLTGLAVAQQTATLAREALVAPATAFKLLRISYARPRREASRTLDDVLAPGAAWWVEYDGTTRAGIRLPTPAPPRVEVLEYDQEKHIAELDADDVSQTLVGSVIAPAPPRRLEALRIVELWANTGADGQHIRAAVEAL